METASFQNVLFLILGRRIWDQEEERKEGQQVRNLLPSLKLNYNLFMQEFIALKKIVHAFLLSSLQFYAFLGKCFRTSSPLLTSLLNVQRSRDGRGLPFSWLTETSGRLPSAQQAPLPLLIFLNDFYRHIP